MKTSVWGKTNSPFNWLATVSISVTALFSFLELSFQILLCLLLTIVIIRLTSIDKYSITLPTNLNKVPYTRWFPNESNHSKDPVQKNDSDISAIHCDVTHHVTAWNGGSDDIWLDVWVALGYGIKRLML